jgi:hypothetical protein
MKTQSFAQLNVRRWLIVLLALGGLSALALTQTPVRAGMPGGMGAAPALLLTSTPAFTSTLKLEGGEISPHALAVDEAAGYAYVGDDSMPGWIIKIRLSDLSRVAALHLNAAEGLAGCGVIDSARGYAYFSVTSGLAYVPGKIVRIRLSDFSQIDTLTLDANDYSAATMVIDPATPTLYLGVSSWPDKAVKVDLNSFTRVGSINLQGTGDAFYSQVTTSALDQANGILYFSGRQLLRLAAVRLSDFTIIQEKNLSDGNTYVPGAAVFDFARGNVYVATRTLSGTDPAGDKIAKIRLSDLTEVGTRLPLQNAERNLHTAVLDPSGVYAYFSSTKDLGSASTPATIVRIHLSDFSRVDAITLLAGETDLLRVALDSPRSNILYTTDTDPGQVVRVNLATFSRTGVLQLRSAETNVRSAVVDPAHGFAYFGAGASSYPGLIVKVRLADMRRIDTLVLASDEHLMISGVIDAAAGFAYFGTSGVPANIIKIDLATFTRTGRIQLDSADGRPTSAVIDPGRGYAYFGTDAEPGKVVRIKLSNFSRQGTLTLDSGEDKLGSAVIDPAAGYAYFGALTMAGQVIKVHLDDLTRTGKLPLAGGEYLLSSAVIDPTAGYAYFGTQTAPGKVVRIRLSDFSRVDAITGTGYQNTFWSAAIDPVAQRAYFGTRYPIAPQIMVIDLNSFATLGSYLIDPSCTNLVSAVLDPTSGAALFGTDTGCVARITMGGHPLYLPLVVR